MLSNGREYVHDRGENNAEKGVCSFSFSNSIFTSILFQGHSYQGLFGKVWMKNKCHNLGQLAFQKQQLVDKAFSKAVSSSHRDSGA